MLSHPIGELGDAVIEAEANREAGVFAQAVAGERSAHAGVSAGDKIPH